MTTQIENELMTRIEGDAPMGRLMRENYWIPFALSSHLVHGEGPSPVRLLGENYVAFRAEDGRIGFLDELCPHRRASSVLGRTEGNCIRCIYHGWKVDVTGCVVEAPTQVTRPEAFAARVRVVHFPVHESGGLAWVWLAGGEPPPFPDLPFRRCRALPLLVRVTSPLQLAAGGRGHDRLRPRGHAPPDMDRRGRPDGRALQPRASPSPDRRATRPSRPPMGCGRWRCARRPKVVPTLVSPST